MTSPPLRYRAYDWRGGKEWLAEMGAGPLILIAPPLLEEMNRCRAFLVAIMRHLAEAGFRPVLPDLPGTGESTRELSEVDWADWSAVASSLAGELKTGTQTPLMASFRGGCLLDGALDTPARWRFAPADGLALTRDLVRARQAASPDKLRAESIVEQARDAACEFAGYLVPPGLFAGLHDARLGELPGTRTVRLSSDPATAELKVEGRPLWRQSEPGTDPALSRRLAADIAQWARACAA
jgi:pimeloyl-ACP methyl ester carboxylesterase